MSQDVPILRRGWLGSFIRSSRQIKCGQHVVNSEYPDALVASRIIAYAILAVLADLRILVQNAVLESDHAAFDRAVGRPHHLQGFIERRADAQCSVEGVIASVLESQFLDLARAHNDAERPRIEHDVAIRQIVLGERLHFPKCKTPALPNRAMTSARVAVSRFSCATFALMSLISMARGSGEVDGGESADSVGVPALLLLWGDSSASFARIARILSSFRSRSLTAPLVAQPSNDTANCLTFGSRPDEIRKTLPCESMYLVPLTSKAVPSQRYEIRGLPGAFGRNSPFHRFKTNSVFEQPCSPSASSLRIKKITWRLCVPYCPDQFPMFSV